ncbi:MAG: cbb3-type cytochrome oxidase assembly protein CcoS [Gammaproteobacteria bacterium]|nr:cbb3-type cytochrome oxidase assembly protein CcoS [Gammaproteobacteria bacterium]|tara:strand:- start:652 stop:807 length:156 start_codon:yes stop_codon:yes gene_type:complete
MTILLLLIPISLLLIAIAGALFVWAVNNDQFEDLDRHGFDILDDSSGEDNS